MTVCADLRVAQVGVTSATTAENVQALTDTRRRSMARIEQGLAGGGSRQDLARFVAAVDAAEAEAEAARALGASPREEDEEEGEEEDQQEDQPEGESGGHAASDPERDAAIVHVARDPEALQALLQQFDASVDSMVDKTSPAPPSGPHSAGGATARPATAATGVETVKVRMDGGWWRVPITASSAPPLPRASTSAAAVASATNGTNFASRLERDLLARKDKAMAVAASRARQAEEEQQLASIPKVSKGSQRIYTAMGYAGGVDSLARQLEHKRSDSRHRQEVLRTQPMPVAFESPIVTANGLVLTRQNQADSRSTRAHPWAAGKAGSSTMTGNRSGVSGAKPAPKRSKKLKQQTKRQTEHKRRIRAAAAAGAAAASGDDSGRTSSSDKAPSPAAAAVAAVSPVGYPTNQDDMYKNKDVEGPPGDRSPGDRYADDSSSSSSGSSRAGGNVIISSSGRSGGEDRSAPGAGVPENADLVGRSNATSKQEGAPERLLGMLSVICDELGLEANFHAAVAQRPPSSTNQRHQMRQEEPGPSTSINIGAARHLLVTACEHLELPRLVMQLLLDSDSGSAKIDAVSAMEKQAALLLQELGVEAVPPSPLHSQHTKAARSQRLGMKQMQARRARRQVGNAATSKGRPRKSSGRGSKSDRNSSNGQVDTNRSQQEAVQSWSHKHEPQPHDYIVQLDDVSLASMGADWLEQSIGLSPLASAAASPPVSVGTGPQMQDTANEPPTSVISTGVMASSAARAKEEQHAEELSTVTDLLARLARASPHANSSTEGNGGDSTGLEPAEKQRAGAMDEDLEKMRQQVAALRSLSTELATTVARRQQNGDGGEPQAETTGLGQLVTEAQKIAAAVSAVGEAAGDYLIHQQHQQRSEEQIESLSSPLPLTHEICAARRILDETVATAANDDRNASKEQTGADDSANIGSDNGELHTDMALLRAFYRYYVPPFGTGFDDARIRLIILSFRKAALQRGIGEWRDWMYHTIEQKHGLDPRHCAPRRGAQSGFRRDSGPALEAELARQADVRDDASVDDGSTDKRGTSCDAEAPSHGIECEADAIARLRQMATSHDDIRSPATSPRPSVVYTSPAQREPGNSRA